MVSRSFATLAIVLSVVIVAGAAGGASGAVDDAPTTQPAVSGDDFRDVTPNVEVWERSALPLRLNAADASTAVGNTNGFVNVESFGTGDVPTDREQQTVYDADSTVTVEFETKLGADTSSFANQDAQLLVARLDEDAPATERLLDGSTAMMATQAMMLYDTEYANANASFRLVSAGQTDGGGELSVEYDLAADGRGPGLYVFFLVQDYDRAAETWGSTDRGFEVVGDELRVVSQGRVLGTEATLVQRTGATAMPTRSVYTAGDDLAFDVDAAQTTDSETVTHAVVVYNRTDYESARVLTEISGDVSGPPAPEQVTVRRQIVGVNGVSRLDRTTLFDTVTLDNGRVARIGSGVSTVDFVAEQLDSADPLDETTGDPVTLDGSVTVVEGDDTETVTVGTRSNWSTGTYQYLYIASGADTSEIMTATGTFTIERATPRSDSSRSRRDRADDDDFTYLSTGSVISTTATPTPTPEPTTTTTTTAEPTRGAPEPRGETVETEGVPDQPPATTTREPTTTSTLFSGFGLMLSLTVVFGVLLYLARFRAE